MENEVYYTLIENIEHKLDIVVDERSNINNQKLNEKVKKYLIMSNNIEYLRLKLLRSKIKGNKSYFDLIEKDNEILELEIEKLKISLELEIINEQEYHILYSEIITKIQSNDNLLNSINENLETNNKILINTNKKLERIG